MRLTVVCGPMKAGKSSTLLDNMRGNYNMLQLIIKPTIDTRKPGYIVTHQGVLIPAVEIDPDHGSLRGVIETFRKDNSGRYPDVIHIDEIQFFKPWLLRELQSFFANNAHFDVHVYGLDLDSNMRPWPIMEKLLPMADHVVKIQADCNRCGESATKTFRHSGPEDQILVGEGNYYEPLCNTCYALLGVNHETH